MPNWDKRSLWQWDAAWFCPVGKCRIYQWLLFLRISLGVLQCLGFCLWIGIFKDLEELEFDQILEQRHVQSTASSVSHSLGPFSTPGRLRHPIRRQVADLLAAVHVREM